MKRIVILSLFVLLLIKSNSQSLINGDLEGTSQYPIPVEQWANVPFSDLNCLADQLEFATPDLTFLNGPEKSMGILGNPYSCSSFISGLDATVLVGFKHFHEGIQQTVSGFQPGQNYFIKFYQTVVKQENYLDTSGSWGVFIDNKHIGTSEPSFSQLPFNSTELKWDLRIIEFVADSTTHTIKFLPSDDDSIKVLGVAEGGLRMGIDAISLELTDPNNLINNDEKVSVNPNPTNGVLKIKSSYFNQNAKVHLLNLEGRYISESSIILQEKTIFRIEEVPGIYFLVIEIEGEIQNKFTIVKI